MIKSVATIIYIYMVIILSIGIATGSAATVDKKTRLLFPVTSGFDANGWSYEWDRFSGSLTGKNKQSRIILMEGNSFYSLDGNIQQLTLPPQRVGATLALAEFDWRTLFGAAPSIQPHDGVRGEGARKSPYNITAIASEKKDNGTLFTVSLADSLPFHYTYFYPNLTLNFLGGKVDTSALKQAQRIGLVDSVFTIQYATAAQVTLLLTREIDKPLIEYMQDTKTVIVALRIKKVVPPVKKIVPIRSGAAKRGLIIVIDPGHGGKDPGAIGASGVREKDVVLRIALGLREKLKNTKNIKIYMTRDTDVFIPLADRTKFANRKKANLFISIHADAISGDKKRKKSIKGYKIYFLSQAKNEEDKLVAMRENAVIKLEERPQNYSALQNVLIEMAGNEYLRESQDLCILLEQKFEGALSKKITKLHRGIGQANFWVLNGAYMPSILIETGFLSHPLEEKMLNTKSFQTDMAAAICSAVVSFTEKYEAVYE